MHLKISLVKKEDRKRNKSQSQLRINRPVAEMQNVNSAKAPNACVYNNTTQAKKTKPYK